jgi:hypothetical protein
MGMYGPITTSAATGGAGVAAGTAVSAQVVRGFVVGMYIQYNDAPPAATTDVGVKTKGAAGTRPSIPLLTITKAATNGYFIPQVATVTAANVATGGYSPFYVDDYIQVDMAGANDGDSVSVWLYMVE